MSEAFDTLYLITKKDVVLDIGSGDGVVLREAARRGAKAVGFEINPFLVLVSGLLSRGDSNVQTRLANFWKTEFPRQVTLEYVFGESRDIRRMSARIQNESNRLNRPIHVLSYGFEVPDAQQLGKTKTHFLYRINPLKK